MNAFSRQDYINYRLKRAAETLDEARILCESSHFSGAVNRIYYAMFYAVNALALSKGFSTASHAQLRGYFNREFIKTGKIAVSFGKVYNQAFENRTKGDYTDFMAFEREQVLELLEQAVEFVNVITPLATQPKQSADQSGSERA